MTRQEQDNEKLFKFLNVVRDVNDHGRVFKSRKTASVREVRDRFKWTLTRTQRAFDELQAEGRIDTAGFYIVSLSDFTKNETIYWIAESEMSV